MEHDLNSQGKINAAQRMRYFMLVGGLSCYCTYFLYMDIDGFFISFTNWTLIITTVSLMASINAGNDSTNYGKDSLQTAETAVHT